MRAFGNISVRYKIMIPLVTLAVIILFMGVTSCTGKNDIMDASTSISGNYARCLDMAGDFNAGFRHMSRIACNHIVAKDETAYRELENKVQEVFADIRSTQEQFGRLPDVGTNEEDLYGQLLQALDAFEVSF